MKTEKFELDIEIYEVDSSTVLDEMGASQGGNSCSEVIIVTA